MAQHVITSADADTVAIRHHLDTLILKLATAQAGSHDAVRESRKHAEAALEILNRSDEVMCEHARFSGISETADEWQCDGCGASWPKSAAPIRPAPLRTHRKVHDPERAAPAYSTPAHSAHLDAPVNSL
jgi:hypothetical protein